MHSQGNELPSALSAGNPSPGGPVKSAALKRGVLYEKVNAILEELRRMERERSEAWFALVDGDLYTRVVDGLEDLALECSPEAETHVLSILGERAATCSCGGWTVTLSAGSTLSQEDWEAECQARHRGHLQQLVARARYRDAWNPPDP